MRHTASGPLGHYCQKISSGCEFCYAGRLQWRFGGEDYPEVGTETLNIAQALVKAGTIFLDQKELVAPREWRKPRIIFPCSMTDMFAEWVPFDWLVAIWTQMQANQRHKFLILTKRPKRLATFASAYPRLFSKPLPNVWLGVSIESAEYAWRAKVLYDVPAAVRWASIEPLLGPLVPPILRTCFLCAGSGLIKDSEGTHLCACAQVGRRGAMRQLDWVVVGGLSGGTAEKRLVVPCKHQPAYGRDGYDCVYCHDTGWQLTALARKWVGDIIDLCEYAGVPVFFKAWGGPHAKAAGHRLWDGRTFRQYPDSHGGITDYVGVLVQQGVLQPALV